MPRSRAPIVILQGPVGSFFGYLARSLSEAGHSVVKINFNLGDWALQSHGECLSYRGGEAAWEAWFEDFCSRRNPRAVLLFGDQRPVHKTAVKVARRHGIRVFSFEEGYLRPDYVTFEEGGNNACSPLPRSREDYETVRSARPSTRPVACSFWSMASAATAYFTLMALGRPLFPGYRHHRERPLARELLLWGRNGYRRIVHHPGDRARQASLVRNFAGQYFVVALQVHDDLQATEHGSGWSQERLIEAAIRSFASHAPRDTRLVLRYHPLDRGHRSYARLVKEVSASAGVAGRVELFYNGHGPTILAHARGLVTVNSTMAISALRRGCPVYALGDCFYRIDGLLAPGAGTAGLDAFWTEPGTVDAALFQKLCATMIERSLINGSFYMPRHWPAMAGMVMQRLAQAGVLSKARVEKRLTADSPLAVPAVLTQRAMN